MSNIKYLVKKYAIVFSIALIGCFFAPSAAYSQLPTVQDLVLYSQNLFQNDSSSQTVTSCVRLDGRCVFKIVFPRTEISTRVNEMQYRLNEIKQTYLANPERELEVSFDPEEIKPNTKNVDINIRIGNNSTRLLTITQQDANFQGISLQGKAELIKSKLERKLLLAKQERTREYLTKQGVIGLLLLSIALLGGFSTRRLRIAARNNKADFKPVTNSNLSFFEYLTKKQNWHIQEIKYRLLQVAEVAVWLGGFLLILGLFPHTRALQLVIITAIRLPLRVTLVGVFTYFTIRIAYSFINRVSSTIVRSQFVLSPKANKRLQLRVNTISQVTKGILTVVLVIMGFLFGLWSVGIDIAPFLAGAGIIGLALSFASQSFIKDALNGFLIITEDQYAVGDIIDLGNVAGKVENINLRITQIRDAEGRLITIPNSEVKIVANLSSQWSQADLRIPVSYQTDLAKAIAIISEVASNLSVDPDWQPFVLEPPSILGVEDFGNRGVTIRLFIKTEPLKQWDVSREFRLRVQTAFLKAEMPIVPPEQIVEYKKLDRP